jgi:hypothetical protein
MHKGLIPYVDLWDRKPYMLFGLYYLFAGISNSVLAYQIPAWIAASLTAFVIVRTALRWTDTQGAVLAGLTYLAMLDLFQGIGGQTPVFYNLPITTAGFLLVRSFDRLRQGRIPAVMYLAMLLCGLAIMVKQTSLFESIFFGLWSLLLLWRSGKPIPWLGVVAMAAIGAAPTLGVAAYYWLTGHWHEFWQAMVVSNVSKQSATAFEYFQRALHLVVELWLIAIPVALSFAGSLRSKAHRPFLLAWTGMAVVGLFSIPNMYPHYCLPLMIPCTLVAAPELNRRTIGVIVAGMLIVFGTYLADAFDFPLHRENRRNMDALAAMIFHHSPRRTLLVFDGPPLLYSLSGTRSLTPLTFPNHLNNEIERNVSHLNTRTEMLRVLGNRPSAVAIASSPRVVQYNQEDWALVLEYTRRHCHLIGSREVSEIGRNDLFLVYGDCL